jgi:hypothetical protein
MNWMKPKSYSFTQLSIFLQVPAKSGIYALHNSTRCIYVGETDNLRKTLQQHLRGDNPWITLWEPNGVYVEPWPEGERQERKNRLVSEFNPILGDGNGNDAGPALTVVSERSISRPAIDYER